MHLSPSACHASPRARSTAHGRCARASLRRRRRCRSPSRAPAAHARARQPWAATSPLSCRRSGAGGVVRLSRQRRNERGGSNRSRRRGRRRPGAICLGPKQAQGRSADQVSLNAEVVVDGGVSRERPLRWALRFEPLLFALPSPNDQMRVLRSIVVGHPSGSVSIATVQFPERACPGPRPHRRPHATATCAHHGSSRPSHPGASDGSAWVRIAAGSVRRPGRISGSSSEPSRSRPRRHAAPASPRHPGS